MGLSFKCGTFPQWVESKSPSSGPDSRVQAQLWSFPLVGSPAGADPSASVSSSGNKGTAQMCLRTSGFIQDKWAAPSLAASVSHYNYAPKWKIVSDSHTEQTASSPKANVRRSHRLCQEECWFTLRADGRLNLALVLLGFLSVTTSWLLFSHLIDRLMVTSK